MKIDDVMYLCIRKYFIFIYFFSYYKPCIINSAKNRALLYLLLIIVTYYLIILLEASLVSLISLFAGLLTQLALIQLNKKSQLSFDDLLIQFLFYYILDCHALFV